MDQAEASGKTVDDALRQALARVGARADEVEITILDEGKRGFLGRGGRDASVRVERKHNGEAIPAGTEAPDTRIPHGPAARPPRGERPQRRGDRNGSGQGRGEGRNESRGRDRSRPVADAAAPRLTADDFLIPGQKPAAPADNGRPARGRGGRSERSEGSDSPRPSRGNRPPQRRERSRDREDEPRVDPDINAEEVDFAAGIVDDMLRLLDINAEISIREPVTDGDGLGNALAVIDISGEDLGLLIGRRGETLLSMQYLVNLIVGRKYPGKGSVTVDVEHYRHRREEQVIALANRMADRVRETGNPITLEPMTPAERRLVHLAFLENEEVETNSVGEGDNRKVVISLRQRG